MENFQEPCSSVNYSDRTSTILHVVFQTALQENQFVLTHTNIYRYIQISLYPYIHTYIQCIQHRKSSHSHLNIQNSWISSLRMIPTQKATVSKMAWCCCNLTAQSLGRVVIRHTRYRNLGFEKGFLSLVTRFSNHPAVPGSE